MRLMYHKTEIACCFRLVGGHLTAGQLETPTSNHFCRGLKLVLNDFEHNTLFYNYAPQMSNKTFPAINAAQNTKSNYL